MWVTAHGRLFKLNLFVNHRGLEIRNSNIEIGPADTPPYGRGPSFETNSNDQNSNDLNIKNLLG